MMKFVEKWPAMKDQNNDCGSKRKKQQHWFCLKARNTNWILSLSGGNQRTLCYIVHCVQETILNLLLKFNESNKLFIS